MKPCIFLNLCLNGPLNNVLLFTFILKGYDFKSKQYHMNQIISKSYEMNTCKPMKQVCVLPACHSKNIYIMFCVNTLLMASTLNRCTRFVHAFKKSVHAF